MAFGKENDREVGPGQQGSQRLNKACTIAICQFCVKDHQIRRKSADCFQGAPSIRNRSDHQAIMGQYLLNCRDFLLMSGNDHHPSA